MTLKQTIQSDLTSAIKSRDAVRAGALRMTLAAIMNAEVAGDTAKELDDKETLAVINKEAKKRREAAEAYDGADRPELAKKELDELAVLEDYLPQPLTTQEVDQMVAEAVQETGVTSMAGMGQVMKVLTPRINGRADGRQVADAVKRALSG